MSADVAREVELLRKRQDKWLMYGWIVAGVLILVAGGAYWYSTNKVATREKQRLDYEAAIVALRDEIVAMPINSIEAANKVIARVDQTRERIRLPDGREDTGWKDTYMDGVTSKVQAAHGRAAGYIKSENERNELISGLASLEAAVKDAVNKKPEELVSLRRRLSEYENRAGSIGPEFETRVAQARIDLNRAVAKLYLDEARAVTAKGEARAAMAAYSKAEDELRTLMDEASTRRNQAAIDWVQPLYIACIEESDKVVTAAFTAEQIDKVPWLDILAATNIAWADDGLKGFRHDNGQVHAIGSDPGSKREGIFSVGDLEYWRDFIMEVEFVPVRGHTKLYWRLGKAVQSAPDEFHVDLNGSDGYKAGQTYMVTASYIGSHRVFKYSANMDREDDVLDIAWQRQRVGAFGGLLAEGAEIKITKLRIKVLRGGKPR